MLVGYMHDRLSAKHFGAKPSGNGRRQSFRHEPLPRMTNTFLAPGNDDPEDIIKSVKRGVFAKRFAGGQVNISNGDFVFSLTESYLIEDGKLTAPLKGTNLIGNGPDVLRKVTMLGGDFELSRRDLDLRQGRADGAGRRRHADDEDRRDHRGRDQDPMTASGGGGRSVPDPKSCQRIAEQMLAIVLKAGADGAEVLVRDGTELEVKVRLGETELIKEAGSRALGLRVLKDQRCAVTYTSDLTAAALERLARDSVELAALAEPDPVAALPSPEEMARDVAELDLWDEGVLSLDVKEGIRRARSGEAAALAFDKRVTNSDGAIFGRTVGASAFATSVGFSGSVRGTHVSFAVEPLCDDADGKKRNGSYWTASRFAAGLADAEQVGVEAARRTVAKLGARKIPDRRGAGDLFDPMRRAGCSASSPASCRAAQSGGGRATWRAAKGRRSRRRS